MNLKNCLTRLLSVSLALIICLSTSVPALSADTPAFSVSINGTLDAEIRFNNQSTLIIDWQVLANKDGLELGNTQGLRLTFDNTILQLMRWDSAGIISDNSVGTYLSPISQAGSAGDYDSRFRVYAAKNSSGNLGYLSITLGDPYDVYPCQKGTLTALAHIRFAFRSGKSVSDLTLDSIRCMNVIELDATSQSSSILLNTNENGVTSYEYLRQANGVTLGGDTLNAPTITYPHGTSDSIGNGEPPGNTPDTSIPNTAINPVEPEPPPGITYTNPYNDIPTGAWFFNAVKYVTDKGLMNGTGNNQFSPDNPMTRAMFATIMFRLAGKPSVTGNNNFSDVVDGQWYSDAIDWADENKLMLGYGNGEFGTNDNVTREQAVTILHRYWGLRGLDTGGQADLSMYTDASRISTWANDAMCWAVNTGLVSGRSLTTIVPQEHMTRAEVAQIILNLD